MFLKNSTNFITDKWGKENCLKKAEIWILKTEKKKRIYKMSQKTLSLIKKRKKNWDVK